MEARYQLALDQALHWITANFKPAGIVVSGSIIRGNPHQNSDLDIYVIHREPFRQRIQKYFNEVPCEFFINNFGHISRYFEQEYRANRPVAAHMLATGQVMMGADDAELIELLAAAKSYMTRSPGMTETKRTVQHYIIASLFENATDLAMTDPITGSYFLHKLVFDVIDLTFLDLGVPHPRPKELLAQLVLKAPAIAGLITMFYQAQGFEAQYEIARQLLEAIGGQLAFFEWDSGPATS
jgi:hypothetical protein